MFFDLPKDEDYTFSFDEPAPLHFQIIGGIFLSIVTIILLPLFFLLFRRRNHRMLQVRSLPTTLIFNLYALIFAWINLFSIILGKQSFCLISEILYAMFPPASLTFLLNIPTLVTMAEFHAAKVQLALSGKKGTIWERVQWLSLKFRIFYMVLTQIVIAAAIIGIHYSSLPLEELDCNWPSLFIVVCYCLFYMLVVAFYFFKLLKLSDPFFLKIEQLNSILPAIPIAFIFILYVLAPEIFPLWFDIRWNFIAICPYVCFFGMVFPALLTHPPFLSRLEKRFDRFKTPNNLQKDVETRISIFALNQGLDPLQAVLQHSPLCQAFTDFLVKEWCVENLYFFKAAEEFKANFQALSEPARVEKAGLIIGKYLQEWGPLEINLESSTKGKILEGFHKRLVTAEMFEEAQKGSFKMMNEHSFQRWLKTPGCRTALAEGALEKLGLSKKEEVSVQLQELF